jgi:hypothetical protein
MRDRYCCVACFAGGRKGRKMSKGDRTSIPREPADMLSQFRPDPTTEGVDDDGMCATVRHQARVHETAPASATFVAVKYKPCVLPP